MLNSILLQLTVAADSIATPISSTVPAQPESLSILGLVAKGGIVMIPIGLLSLLLIYLFVERSMVVSKALKTDANFMNSIKDAVHQGNIDAAKTVAKNNSTPIGITILKGLNRIGKPIKEIEGAMENTAKVELSRIEKNMGYLSTIAAIAPMFGFLGTIFGVIKIFYNISLADNISIGLIAGGLYEKMITSAAGLVVGILAFVAHHLLVNRVDKLVSSIEESSVQFLDILSEPASK